MRSVTKLPKMNLKNQPVLEILPQNPMVEMYDEQKNTVAEICKIYDISRPSFYNYLKRKKKIIADGKMTSL